jgi:hypothetical protein
LAFSLPLLVIARSASDEAIHCPAHADKWIASLRSQ